MSPFTHEYLQGLLYCLERQHEMLTMLQKTKKVALVAKENNNAVQCKSWAFFLLFGRGFVVVVWGFFMIDVCVWGIFCFVY